MCEDSDPQVCPQANQSILCLHYNLILGVCFVNIIEYFDKTANAQAGLHSRGIVICT